VRIPLRRLLTRRRFLGLAAAAATAAGGYTFLVEPHWVSVVERDLPLAGLPPDLVGRTLVQISDLHVGPLVDNDYLVACLKLVGSLEPDIVAITGDFMTCHRGESVDATALVLEHLPRPTMDVFAVLGNHDYGGNWCHEAVADRLAARLAGLGIVLLRNERRSVGGLQIAGVDDYWSPRFAPSRVIPQLDASRDAVVLCHNPDGADRPEMSGVRGWVLAGHTHGGQCKPPFLPPPLIPVKNRRYTSGAFALGEGRSMYINRGLGYIKKVRFNARPEITAFRLVTV
jgi:predicted MPP superfamily phosphohydrolase